MKLSEDTRSAIEKLLLEKPQQNPYKRFTILAYQLAEVGKTLRYAEIYPEERTAQLAFLKTGMSDLLAQILIMAKLYGFDVDELERLGTNRLSEFRLRGKYMERE